MVRRAEKIRARLGGDGAYSPPAPSPRPKGMHRRTYARLCAELRECQLRALWDFARGR
jgi:hypothetical protein